MEKLKKYVSKDSPIYKAQDSFNHDRGGGFEIVADDHNIEIKPSNAQEIAKKCIIDLVINEEYEKRLDYYSRDNKEEIAEDRIEKKIAEIYKEIVGYKCPEWFKKENARKLKEEQGEPIPLYIRDTVKKMIHLNNDNWK